MSMTAERFKEIEQTGGCADLSARAKFRLTGADRVRYLNGQVTNDVRRATPAKALYACVTNVKGRIEADVFIHAAEDALYIDAEPDAREMLAARLEKYIIADDVVLEDVTEEWGMCHCFGAKSEGLSAKDGERVVASRRFGEGGFDAWMTRSDSSLFALCTSLSADEAETLRIIRGIPRWPSELNGDAFPQEAGLEATAMDFAKGCYIGQEVLSRIRTTGKMPRGLVRWEAVDASSAIAAGAELFATGANELSKSVGVVTSVAWHPAIERPVGLAYLKQGVAKVDSQLLVGNGEPSIAAEIKILS